MIKKMESGMNLETKIILKCDQYKFSFNVINRLTDF